MGDKKYLYCANKGRIDVYCHKLGIKLWTQTSHEAAFVLMLDNDPKVKSFSSQPGKYAYKGKNFQPDFLVEYTDGRFEFIEVHSREDKSEKFKARIALFTEGFKEKLGAELTCKYNDEIDFQYIRNIEHLSQYNRMTDTDIDNILRVAWFFPQNITLGEAEHHLKQQLGLGFPMRVLMWLRLYDFDWYTKINANTPLTRATV